MLKNLDKYRLIPFVQYAKLWIGISILLILIGIGFMVKNERELGHPFFLGIDFTGGSFIQLRLPRPGDTQIITEIVKKYSVGEPWVQLRAKDPREVEIRVNIDTSEAASDAEASRLRVEKFDEMKADLAAAFGVTTPETPAAALPTEDESSAAVPPESAKSTAESPTEAETSESQESTENETAAGGKAEEPREEGTEGKTANTEDQTATSSAAGIEQLSFDYVGPVVGGELIRNAILALILGSIAIMIYIFIRFNRLVFAIAAVIALLHDVLITLSGTAIFRLEINAFFIAVILTIIGYSINDTIIIYDRIRENLKNLPQLNFPTLINLSLTQTLARSINTSLTTITILIALLIWGGRSIQDFTMAMLFGMISGAYSSIFIAAPIVLWFSREKISYAKIPARIDLLAAQEQAVLGTWEEEVAEEAHEKPEPAPHPGGATETPAAAPVEEPPSPPAPSATDTRASKRTRHAKKKRKKPRRR